MAIFSTWAENPNLSSLNASEKKPSGQMVKTRIKIALGQTRVHTEEA